MMEMFRFRLFSSTMILGQTAFMMTVFKEPELRDVERPQPICQKPSTATL
jgi:hypothetical protein